MLKNAGLRHVLVAVASSWIALQSGLAQDEPPGFVQLLPSAVKWLDSPVVPKSQLAVIYGNPQKTGPFVIRVKLPAGARVMPHTHGQIRTYTVLAGEMNLGFGDRYDPAALRRFPQGSWYRVPANAPHFQSAGPAETIVQVESIGPTSIHFMSPADDPRKK